MAVHVKLRSEQSGEIKSIKVGWSWTLFLFGTILGIPLFYRRLYAYGFGIIAYNILCLALPDHSTFADAVRIGGGIGLAIFLGRDGNKQTAKNYLARGWVWVDPSGQTAVYAREKWGSK